VGSEKQAQLIKEGKGQVRLPLFRRKGGMRVAPSPFLLLMEGRQGIGGTFLAGSGGDLPTLRITDPKILLSHSLALAVPPHLVRIVAMRASLTTLATEN